MQSFRDRSEPYIQHPEPRIGLLYFYMVNARAYITRQRLGCALGVAAIIDIYFSRIIHALGSTDIGLGGTATCAGTLASAVRKLPLRLCGSTKSWNGVDLRSVGNDQPVSSFLPLFPLVPIPRLLFGDYTGVAASM